jgi:predicted membrane chloride channel (bestrophin family)
MAHRVPQQQRSTREVVADEVSLRLARARIEKIELDSDRRKQEIVSELRQQVVFAIIASKRHLRAIPKKLGGKIRQAQSDQEAIEILTNAIDEALQDLSSLVQG